MKLKLDENLPESLVEVLSSSGHDVDNVRIENIICQNDRNIWKAAQDNSRFLITQDLDFSDVRIFSPGSHHGLMLVRLRVPGRLALAARVGWAFNEEDASS
jgi:predicted nuclease of predicted toxin-antitoxin system